MIGTDTARITTDAATQPADRPHSDVRLALGFTLAALLLVTALPRLLRLSPGAREAGFDPALAHVLLAIAALACVIVAAIPVVRGDRCAPAVDDAVERRTALPLRTVAAVSLLVMLLPILLYFPPFLARYGPYGEDKYFLSVLQRMLDGQRPYTDFEFIYGPLLIQPAAAWVRTFGYSLESYYTMLAAIEAVTFAGITFALGRVIPDRRTWLIVAAIAFVLLLNDNLGLSWIALRRLLPILVLFAWATRGQRPHGWAGVAVLVSIQCVTSVEYAAACIIAIVGTAVVESVAVRNPHPVLRALWTVAIGGAVAGVLAFAMMGPHALEWLRATWRVIALRGGGEAAFRFVPTVNAAAVIALLFLACVRMGTGMAAVLRRPLPGIAWSPLLAGDRLLLASLAYAVVAARSGLARSDMYHLVPPVLGLIAVALMPLPFSIFTASNAMRRATLAAVALVCITYAPGLAGAGRIWAEGLALGARDVVTGRPLSETFATRTRGPHIGAERSHVPPVWVDLAGYMADGERLDRPVLFYGQNWGLDRYIGVPKPRGVYPTDDYLVSDDIGLELRAFLDSTPDALVVIDHASWRTLVEDTPPPVRGSMFWIRGRRSPVVRFLEFWSSSHYGTAVVDEQIRKERRWAATVGTLLAEKYDVARDFDGLLVLERRS